MKQTEVHDYRDGLRKAPKIMDFPDELAYPLASFHKNDWAFVLWRDEVAVAPSFRVGLVDFMSDVPLVSRIAESEADIEKLIMELCTIDPAQISKIHRDLVQSEAQPIKFPKVDGEDDDGDKTEEV
jgi:hypothetical protein